MIKRTVVARSAAWLLASSALALTLGGPAWAQQAAPDNTLEELVVTGSRIRGVAPVGSTVVQVDRDTIATSPATNTYPAYTSYSYTPSTSAYAPSSSAPASASQLPRRSVPFRGRSASVYSDAPPAYTPSAASPLSPLSPSQQSHRYGATTSSMGIESEHLLGRAPESMGRPHDEEAAAPSWNRRVRRRLPPWLSLRMVLLALVLMIASVGFLASSYRVFRSDGNVRGPRCRPSGLPHPLEHSPADQRCSKLP